MKRRRRHLVPGSPAWQRRVDHVLREEGKGEESWWWLSFADPGRPEGQQFLGVAIVRARGVVGATQRAWALGINPGGEVGSLEIPPENVPHERFRDRLLSKAELDEAGL